MYIATRTHDYGRFPINQLGQFLRKEGFDAAQLVLAKAFNELNSYDNISKAHLEEIRKNFDENQIKIHILGCYMDLGNPDKDLREKAVNTFKNFISHGKFLGVHYIGTETALPELNEEEKKIWHPFMMDSIGRIVEESERVGQNIALEPVRWHSLENLEKTIEVFEKFKSDRLKIIFDPGNLIEPKQVTMQKGLWNDWFSTIGDKIETIHLKDFVFGPNNERIPKELGTGMMEYDEIVKWMKVHKPDITVVREWIVPEKGKSDIEFIRNLWK